MPIARMRPDTALPGSLLAVFLLLAGCGPRTLMPAPALYHGQAGEDVFANVPEHRRSNVVGIMYATDRLPVDGEGPTIRYGAERSSSVAVGVARVRIGRENLTWKELVDTTVTRNRKHKYAVRYVDADERARLPHWPWYVNMTDDPEITASEVEERRAEVIAEIHAVVTEQLADADRNEIYVFVHGFNNTFEYAACTLAELWHTAGRPGLPILYSWPAARSGVFGYDPDRESSEYTVGHLKNFIRILAGVETLERVHVIAHSRGTDVLATAMRELHIEYSAKGLETKDELKLGHTVFIAADIDSQVAQQRLGGEKMFLASDHVTIYTGESDQALKISADMFKSESRIGQIDPDKVKGYGRYTLRMYADRYTAIHNPRKTGFLGHGYYLSDPAVSSDLILMLRDDRRPGAEHGRPLIKHPSGMWILPDDYPNNTVTTAAGDD
jgi:esterase/lipase superfamily enzyme